MYSQLSPVPSPPAARSLFSFLPSENGGRACSLSVASTMYIHCRIKAVLSCCNSKLKYGIGTQPQVCLTPLALMLQSRFAFFLVITQISAQMRPVFKLASIRRQDETGGGVTNRGTRYTSSGFEGSSQQPFCLAG